eukprot:jgi/Ulvmu1/4607/UM002_0336.1
MSDLRRTLAHWRSISLPSNHSVCHAWKTDLSMLAYCDGSPDIHIVDILVQATGDCECRHVATLREHTQALSAMQWASSGLLVTCSHDRTGYVWQQDSSTGAWTQQKLIMKLQRAALCLAWSPLEKKFAVGSGTKNVCIAEFSTKDNWWAGRLIRNSHSSSVCCVAWSPDDVCLATGSTDGRCRIFYADTEIDPQDKREFGDLLYLIDLHCWVNSLSWSPDALYIAAAGHDSHIHLLQLPNSGEDQIMQRRVKLPSLPAHSIVHADAGHVIAAGWDGVIYTVQTHESTNTDTSNQEEPRVMSGVGQSLAEQCQAQCISVLGRRIEFHHVAPADANSDTPYHTACVQELKVLKLGKTSVVSSLDRKGGLHLWRWIEEAD